MHQRTLPFDGTLNNELPRLASETLDWGNAQVHLYEHLYRIARTLRRFERAGFFVSYDGGSFATATMPKITITREDRNIMASKSKLGEWNGIARVPFNVPERKKFDAWLKKDPDVFFELGEIIAMDYKLSLSHEDRSGAVMASLSCYNPKEPNYKYTLVSRAPTVLDAIAVTVFKHLELAQGKWQEPDADVDMWG